jgi:hypothetical protein
MMVKRTAGNFVLTHGIPNVDCMKNSAITFSLASLLFLFPRILEFVLSSLTPHNFGKSRNITMTMQNKALIISNVNGTTTPGMM